MVLKDANFVSSFQYKDNFVYFFLRETAVEKGKVSKQSKGLQVIPKRVETVLVKCNNFRTFSYSILVCPHSLTHSFSLSL